MAKTKAQILREKIITKKEEIVSIDNVGGNIQQLKEMINLVLEKQEELESRLDELVVKK